MKQRFAFLLAFIMLAVCLSSCSGSSDKSDHGTPGKTDHGSPEDVVSEDIKITKLHADWPYYDSLQELAEAATDIYEGKIVNISFDIVDMYTGKSLSESESVDKSHLELYTVYEVEVSKTYKGTEKDKRSFCVVGGLDHYKLEDQYDLMSSAQIYTPDMGIKVIDEFRTLNIGESYLFLTADNGGTYDYIVNANQFAFETNDTVVSDGFNYQKVKDYVLSVNE